MKKNYRILLLVFAVLGVTLQCKKKCDDPYNPECENYDPCYGKKPTSAAFKIWESGSSIVAPTYAFAYETDTIIGRDATFAAVEQGNDVQYLWEIGSETYTTSKVTLSFSSVPNNTTIPIKLVVTKKRIDKQCFPTDTGIDSTVQHLHVHRRCLVSPTSTVDTFVYRGHHLDTPHEVRDVTLCYNTTGSSIIWGNLIRERPIAYISTHSSRYRMLCFSTNTHMFLEGVAFLNPKDSITIKYEYSFLDMEPKKTLPRVFVGKKIN